MAYTVLLSSPKPFRCSRAIPRSSQVPYVTSPRVSSTTSIQSRGIWRYTYYRHGSRSSDERRRLEKYQRHNPSKLRDGVFGHRPQSPSLFDNHHPWWNPGWGWSRWKFNVPPYSNERTSMDDYWEARRVQLEQRMEQMKKEIGTDPYAALFGRRLEPFKSSHKHENIFSSLFQSIFSQGSKAEAEPKATDTTARVKTIPVHSSDPRPSDKQSASPRSEVNTYEGLAKDDTGGYEFDPITGRMVLKKGDACEGSRNGKHTESPNISIHSNTIQSDDAQSAGFLSPVDRSEQPDAKGVTKTGAHEIIVQSGSVDGPSPQTTNTTQGPSEYAYGSNNLREKPGNSDEDILKEPTDPQDESMASAKPASDIETTNEPLSTDHAHLEAHNVPPSAVSHQNEPTSSAPVQTQNPLATPTVTFNEVKQQEEWVTQAEKAEDLDILRARDIRTPYELENKDQDSEEQLREKRRKLDLAYEMAEDPVKDLDAQRIREKYGINESSESKETVSEPPESPKPQSRTQSSTTASTSLPRAQEVFHNVSVDPNHEVEEQYNQVQVSPSDSWATTTYRVLVYDPSSSQVMEAETSSSLQSTDKLLSPAEVLSRLSHPAKFVPYLAKMHNDGYEIVSGGEDIVVFKQASQSGSAIGSKIPSSDSSAGQLASTPSDHGNIRAATAPSHVSPNPAIGNTAEASKDTDHAKAWPRVRTALRRMLIGGVATAGTCYAIGVVVEYFRTGGQDGLGIDGFTEFESERRHRD